MKFLKALDGYKRVIALLTYVLEGLAQAAGLGDHTPMLGTVFSILRWDPAGMGLEIGPALQAGFTAWAVIDGFRKAKATSPATAARLSLLLVALSLALGSLACSEGEEPNGPSPITINVNNAQNQNQGAGNQSPTGPGEGGCEAVRYVELRFELGGVASDHVAPGQTGTVIARALSASRSPIAEGRCLPAPTWGKTGQCDLGGDATAFTRTLTGRTSGSGSCTAKARPLSPMVPLPGGGGL